MSTSSQVSHHRAATERPGSLLIVHNYTNRTGYAWRNIGRLFSSVAEAAEKAAVRTVVAYAQLEEPAQTMNCPLANIVELDYGRRGLRTWLAIRDLIRRFRIRHVYLTDQAPTSVRYAWMRLWGVRRIIVHCRVSVPDPRPARPDALPIAVLKHCWTRLPGIQADRVYVVSDFVGHRLRVRGRIPASRLVRIYNGVDTDALPTPVRREAEDSARRIRLFMGARASLFKGVDTLLNAMARVARLHPDCILHLRYAGDGPDLDRIRALTIELGLAPSVTILGEVHDVRGELRDADIVVVPSNWGDACPSAVLEALAAGKPLITTMAGGIPELVTHRVTALLVQPGDSEALAEAIHELSTDPALRERLGREARRAALERFTIARYHADVCNALHRDGVLPGGPPANPTTGVGPPSG